MASSSVSQDDVENDFELASRRSRIRTARARIVNPAAARPDYSINDCEERNYDFRHSNNTDTSSNNAFGFSSLCGDHDGSPKFVGRAKEQKRSNRLVLINKTKQIQRDRRKLREKRRSTGVMHMPSTESTGGSTGEDEIETPSQSADAIRQILEGRDHSPHKDHCGTIRNNTQRRNKSPSDLEADDEGNEELEVQTFDKLSPETPSSDQNDQSPVEVETSRSPLDEAYNLLHAAKSENQKLRGILESKERRILDLENMVSEMQEQMATVGKEKEKLAAENAKLVRTMACLTTK